MKMLGSVSNNNIMQKINWKQGLIFGSGLVAIVFGALKLTGVIGQEKLSDYLIPTKHTISQISDAERGFQLETYEPQKDGVLFRQVVIRPLQHKVMEAVATLSANNDSVTIKSISGITPDFDLAGPEEKTYPNTVKNGLILYSREGFKTFIINNNHKLDSGLKNAKCIDIASVDSIFKRLSISIYCKGIGKIGYSESMFDESARDILKQDSGKYYTASISTTYDKDKFEDAVSAAVATGTDRFLLGMTKESNLSYSETMNLKKVLAGIQGMIFEEAHKLDRGGFHTLEEQKMAIYGMKEPLNTLSAASLASCVVSYINEPPKRDSLVSYFRAKAAKVHFSSDQGRLLTTVVADCLKNIPGLPKTLATSDISTQTQTPSATLNSGSALAKGTVVFSLEGRDNTYKLIKLAPHDSAQVFALMATQPTKTMQHQTNTNPIFKDANIVQEPSESIYQTTSLVIGGNKIFTSSPDDEKLSYQLQNLISLDIQPELLLIEVFEGGNSCESLKQVLFARGADNYFATPAFGRCGLSWFDDKEHGTTYFVYPANKYNPLEVMALTRTPH